MNNYIGEIMSKEYRIYKPNKTNNGAASKIQCATKKKDGKYDEAMLFWEMAPQTGTDDNDNASFDWKAKDKETKSVLIKLGIVDVAEILLFLHGRKKEVKLFHQNNNGNTAMNFTMYNDQYSVQLSSKVGENITRVKHLISPGEGMVLAILLKDFVTLYHGWT